ncbi:presenilin-associated rhomboid-like protein, mitochondrial isoform X1 [Carettochelys insculpta]|uniref:presenilin-associated rhomboid-like protein, mitochondrial isoform X1 n=1 Tax=Carettochelys insculpta TaxID=44489 RepID=UPI003EBC95B6
MAWSCWARLCCREALGGCRSRGPRFTLYAQQRHGFKRMPQKTEPGKQHQKSRSKLHKSSLSPPVEETIHYTTSPSLKRLVKPFFFTIGFTGCAFGSAAIWQYEYLKSRLQNYFDEARADWMDRLRPQKKGDFRKQINKWWNSLSEDQRTMTGIIAANVFVFCLWRIPSMQRTMFTYFTSNPASRVLCSPMLLSTFSHFSFVHMAVNMCALWSFSSSIMSLLGREQFVALYLSAGVISTFVSYVSKVVTRTFEPSLGASGAIMAVLAVICTKIPEAKLSIILFPLFTFTAGSALKAIIAIDTAGLVLGWKVFDHAAHLGGVLFGMWYVTYGHELIWKKREVLVKAWHEMRSKSRGKGGGESR